MRLCKFVIEMTLIIHCLLSKILIHGFDEFMLCSILNSVRDKDWYFQSIAMQFVLFFLAFSCQENVISSHGNESIGDFPLSAFFRNIDHYCKPPFKLLGMLNMTCFFINESFIEIDTAIKSEFQIAFIYFEREVVIYYLLERLKNGKMEF